MQVATSVARVAPSVPLSVPVGARAASPGLVPLKTTVPTGHVSFAPPEVALRRIARLRRAVWAAGQVQTYLDDSAVSVICWFVTLTYVGIDDWRPEHISEAIRRYRKWCAASLIGCRYVWVAELQSRGAVHYHVLTWLPRDTSMPHWDLERARGAWWPHGMTNTQPARAGIGYLMKYLSKLGECHRFPKNLRLYGMGGMSPTGRQVVGWVNLPEWVKRQHGVGEVRRVRQRLTCTNTGELLESPWQVQRVPGGLRLHQVRDIPERFFGGPYSTWPRQGP
jgi:hypothetical protein